MTKHRAGRPRKAGPRQPCGHLKSSGAEPPSPAQIKRIQTGLLKSSTEQLLGDEVGRLYFHKLLTERQVSAAFRVADVPTDEALAAAGIRLPAPVEEQRCSERNIS